MIKIGGGDGPRRVNPIEPGGRAGDKGREDTLRDPKPAKKPERQDDVSQRPRRAPDSGMGENVDIDA